MSYICSPINFMKRLSIILSLCCLSVSGFSQNTQSKTVIATKPAPSKPVFKDVRDSASYTAGIHIVNKYKSIGITNFNSTMVARAVNDLQTGKPQLISNGSADTAVMAYQDCLMNNKPIKKNPAVAGRVLNDLRDSASYASGLYLVNFFNDFDIINFNPAIITRAINDLQANKPQLIKDSLANMVAMRYQYQIQLKKNKDNIDAGKKFLAENKKRPEVKVTKSGLQYEVITQGTGVTPAMNDKVSCQYTGAFIDGTEFNNSYKMGGPVSFNVNGVIKGWTEALLMMPVGSKWKLYIPFELGYGPGQYNTIPGGSALVFEIDLLGIEGK